VSIFPARFFSSGRASLSMPAAPACVEINPLEQRCQRCLVYRDAIDPLGDPRKLEGASLKPLGK
jgi:hypothetical protein